MPARRAVVAREAHNTPPVGDPTSAPAETPLALRDAAATLDYVARLMARHLPAGQTDVRGDVAALREVADNVRGYAATMEAAR